jgi:MOSC domain-containing protein YiiM
VTDSDGIVEAIYLAEAAGAPMRRVDRARALESSGLEGDRYAKRTGHWSPMRRAGDGLTIVEAEQLEAIAVELGRPPLPDGWSRRNVIVRGIRLDPLIGRRFRLGTALLHAVRRCEPCTYIEGLLGVQVLHPLVHRGGLRVEILAGGEIAVGDRIEVVEEAEPAA